MTLGRILANVLAASLLAPFVAGAVAGLLHLMGATDLAATCGAGVVGMFFWAWVAGQSVSDDAE